ncbi:MAG: tetraacyldisaccharide 4'-kinase [Pseudomonadales bacterium]
MNKSIKDSIEDRLNKAWYGTSGSALSTALNPLSVVYRNALRLSKPRNRDIYRSPLPIIVIGNIVVGGAGKTPLVLALCEHLRQQGWRPAVLSRGYRAQVDRFPHMVSDRDDAITVGDEPKLLHSRLGLPVCIDPERSRGARYLFAHKLCDVIVLDDGLQHLKLARDIEIAVVDGQRLLGNGLCLPAGPLREPKSRLSEVDYVVMNGVPSSVELKYDAVMTLKADEVENIVTGERLNVALFKERLDNAGLLAVCGIGNPRRFFQTLLDNDLHHTSRPFADHHQYEAADLRVEQGQQLIMTEKDAVKCRSIADEHHWFLRISAALPAVFYQAVTQQLKQASIDLAKAYNN